MVDQLRSDAAQMAGLFVETVFYGMYLVSVGFVSVYVLRDGSGRWRVPHGVRAATLTVALILWVNSTLNIGWGLTRQMRMYIFKPHIKKATWIDLAKPYTVIVQTLTADLFLTYRCWVVYGRSWKVALFPVVLSMGSLAVFVWIMVIQTQLNAHIGSVSHQVTMTTHLLPLFTAQFSLTTALNVYATSLIVYRIAKMDRATAGLNSTIASTGPGSPEGEQRRPKTRTSLQKIVQIIIESACIYTIASAMTFGSYKSNAQYITSAFDIIIVGLAFNAIIIRLARESRRAYHGKSRTKLTTLRFDQPPQMNSAQEQESPVQSMTSIQFSPNSEKACTSVKSETVGRISRLTQVNVLYEYYFKNYNQGKVLTSVLARSTRAGCTWVCRNRQSDRRS